MFILAKQFYFDIPFRFLRKDRVPVMTRKLREPLHYSNLIYRVIYIFFVYLTVFMHGTRGLYYAYIQYTFFLLLFFTPIFTCVL